MSLETKVSSDTEVAEVSSRQETQTAEVVDREKSNLIQFTTHTHTSQRASEVSVFAVTEEGKNK